MHEQADLELERLFTLDDAVGPARPLDGARAASLIEAALRGAGFPPAGPTGGGGGGSGMPVRAARRLGAGKLTAIAGGLAAVATVALLATRGGDARAISEKSPPAAMTASPPAAAALPPAPAASPPAVAPAAAAAPDEAAAVAAPVDSRDDSPAVTPRHPSRTRSAAHHRATTTTAAATPAVAPADLLAEANAARARHDWRAADVLYGRVTAGDQDALASQTALVASGSLHLEHLGDPRGATRRFRSALARNGAGALAEDARWGLAEAAHALGDADAERRALDDFLAHHASSALAPRARERRDALRVAP